MKTLPSLPLPKFLNKWVTGAVKDQATDAAKDKATDAVKGIVK